MNSLELFALLRKQVESILITDEVRPATDRLPIAYAPGSKEYASDCLRRYNYEAYLEITDPKTIVVAADVENDAIAELDSMLDAYMETYAPNRPNLKKYTKLVSLYLAFVARRPLHPPSMMMAPRSAKGSTAKSRCCCVAKKGDLDERFPICRHCVAYSKSKAMQ